VRRLSRLAESFLLGATVALQACGETSASERLVRIDSVDGRIPRTMSAQPIDSGRWHLVRARDIQPPELDSAELVEGEDGRPLVRVYRIERR
jgi:hypothetical protein